MPSREEYLKWDEWAEDEADRILQCKGEFHPDWHGVFIEALCNRVWNEAMERAAKYIEDQSLPDTYSEPCLAIFAEELRELKQGETK